jgi:hypothetical protein
VKSFSLSNLALEPAFERFRARDSDDDDGDDSGNSGVRAAPLSVCHHFTTIATVTTVSPLLLCLFRRRTRQPHLHCV